MIDRLPTWVLIIGLCLVVIFLIVMVKISSPADSPIPLLFSIAIGMWCGWHLGGR